MKFVSCLEIAKPPDYISQSTHSFNSDDTCGYCICETYIQGTQLPSTVTELENLLIDKVRVTEGDTIYSLEKVSLSSFQLFASVKDDNKTRCNVLYELLRYLTAHKFYIESFQNKIEFTRWAIHGESNGGMNLTMEQSSGRLAGKLAQLNLRPAIQGEMDMFLLFKNLFDDHCSRGDELHHLTRELQETKDKLSSLEDERKLLDKILEERDDRARKIVIGLLNEKKRKVWELTKILREQKLDVNFPEYRSDEGIVNKYIVEPVSELNSPGKRRAVSSLPVGKQSPKRVKRKLKFEGVPSLSGVGGKEGSVSGKDDFREINDNTKNQKTDNETSTDSELFVKIEEKESRLDVTDPSSSAPTENGHHEKNVSPVYTTEKVQNSEESTLETESGEETEV